VSLRPDLVADLKVPALRVTHMVALELAREVVARSEAALDELVPDTSVFQSFMPKLVR
jgi:hypothetical protein